MNGGMVVSLERSATQQQAKGVTEALSAEAQ